MLTMHNVSKVYRNGENLLNALDQVSLSLREGDFAFLLGESGSGKSTLLNVLSGLDTPDAGEILVDGVDTGTFTRKDWATFRNQEIGFVFQEYNLIDHLNIVDNVALPLVFRGEERKKAREAAKEELDRIGLSKHLDKKPDQLSGGQQQRVSIARALVTNPKIILADEPTGSLDEEMGQKVIAYLKKHAEDKIVLVVTHDEGLAELFANRKIFIEDGRITDDTRPVEPQRKKEEKPHYSLVKLRWSMLFAFARNNLFSRMFRSIFTSAIVSIGFVAILLLTFIIGGIRGSVADTIADLIPPDEYQLHPIQGTLISDDTFDAIGEDERIDELRYNIDLSLQSMYQDNVFDFNYRALPYDTFAFQRDGVLHGRLPAEDDEVVVSLGTALRMRDMQSTDEDSYGYVFGLIEGSEMTITETDETVTVVGMSEEQFQQTVYLDYDALEGLAGDVAPEAQYKQSALAYLDEDSDVAVSALTQELRDEYDMSLRNVFGEITQQIDDVMDTALRWFIGIALISLAVAGILIGLVIYTSVLERIREIGILTALGVRHKGIRGIFIIEAGLSGLLSGAIAVGLAYVISNVLNRLFNNFIEAPLNLITGGDIDITLLSPSIPAIAIVLIAGVLYSMLAGWIPSNKAAKMDAIKALRKE